MTTATTEVWYVWREFATVEGEEEPRLLIPWADPNEYEFPMDWQFNSPEDAISVTDSQFEGNYEWLLPNGEGALDEDDGCRHVYQKEGWVLCKQTTEPVTLATEDGARCEHGMFFSGAGACPQCGGGAT